MLDRRLKLGTFWGIGLYVHWTFALLIGFFAYQASGQGIVAVLFSIAIVLGVFFCVTLHEYGHALAARQFGIPTIDITLLPIGGVARLQRMPRIPWQELVVAVAGPAVNVVIASLLAIGFAVVGGLNAFFGETIETQAATEGNLMFGDASLTQFAFYMMVVNVTLVVFNMIPAFPMDGGRVLRSVMAMMMDYRRATVVASRIGLVCAGIMALLALTGDQLNPIPLLIAVFIAFAGMAEARQVDVMESVRGLTVRQVMIRAQNAVPMEMPLSELARFWQSTRATALPILSPGGIVLGMIRLEAVSAALKSGKPDTITAGQLIDHETSNASVGIDEDLESVILRIGNRGRQVAVVDREGRLAGILDLNSMLLRGPLQRVVAGTSIPDDRFDAVS